jgi:tetratricopeptide (TPR) repeat protein
MKAYPRPKTSEEFELLCLGYLRRAWKRRTLVLYAKRGEEQHGVDIVDADGAEFCRAAQCKLHEESKALTATEVRGEVAKADGFPLPLHHYAICTTGRKTHSAQDACMSLNEERRSAGKFTVELIYWEDIELLLDEDDEFRESYESSSHASVRNVVGSEVSKRLAEGLAPVRAQLQSIQDNQESGAATAFDAEIDRAKRLLGEGQLTAARALFQDLKNTKYDRLSPLQRFRCLANLGLIEAQIGSEVTAGRLMLQACEEFPTHEQALVMRTQAESLLGHAEEAWQWIQKARAAAPDDVPIAAGYVAYAPQTVSLNELEVEFAGMASHPQLLFAFQNRCANHRDNRKVIEYAERLKALGHETADSLFLHACALAAQVLPDDPRDVVEERNGREVLRTSIRMLDDVAQRGDRDRKGDPRVPLRARLAQVDMASHLDDSAIMENSLDEAARLAAKNQVDLAAIDVMRSQVYLAQRNFSRAIEYAERAARLRPDDTDAIVLLAVAKLNRNEGFDRENGRRELKKQLAKMAGLALEQALSVLVTDYLATKSFEPALEVIDVAKLRGLDSACGHAQLARVAAAQEQTAEARALAKRGVTDIKDQTTASTRRLLARVLRCEDPDVSIDVLRPLGSKQSLTSDTKNLLAIALEANKHDVILEWCGELWKHRALDPPAQWNYLNLLEVYDPQKALQFIGEALSSEQNNDDAGALRARRCLLQQRLGQTVDALSLADLPSVEAVSQLYVPLIIEALRCNHLYRDACAYAYRSVLRFPDDPGAHAALVSAFLFGREDKDNILAVTPEKVALGSAVQIQESDDVPTWCTIEDHRVPGWPDVIARTDSLAQILIGRKVGDTVNLVPHAISPRMATIRAIEAGTVYRFNDCLSKWQLRFPEVPFLEQLKFEKDPVTGELDLSPLIEIMKRSVENAKHADGIYKGGAMPISFMARHLHRSIFKTMTHLASDDDLFVNCVFGADPVFTAALASLNAAKGIVIDGTALWTLQQLGLTHLLEKFPFPVGVVQQGIDVVQKEVGDTHAQGDGALVLDGERPELIEIPEELKVKQTTTWQDVAARLAKTHLFSSERLAKLPAKRREELSSFTDDWTAHAMAAAAEREFLLWSDDRLTEFLAKEFFGVGRVWTQVILHWFFERGVLDASQVRRASAKLQARRYSGTLIDEHVLLEAAKLADWKLSDPVFERNLKVIREPTTRAVACGVMALTLIKACTTEVKLPPTQSVIVCEILERLRTRDPSLRLVHYVLRNIQRVMPLNPIGAQTAISLVSTWLRTNQRVIMSPPRGGL